MFRVRRVSLFYWGLGIGLAVAPVCWSFELLSFQHAKEGAYAVLLLLLVGLAAKGHRIGSGLAFYGPLWLLLGAMLLLALAPIPIAAPTHSAEAAFRFGLLLLLASFCYPFFRYRVFRTQAEGALIVSGMVAALLALGQFFGILNRIFPAFPHYDQELYSVFGNQDDLGGYLAMIFIVVLSAWWSQRIRGGSALPLLGLLGTVLLLSGARSAWMAAAAGLLVAGLTFRPAPGKLAVTGGAGTLAVLGALGLHGPYLLSRLGRSFSDLDIGWQARLWMWDATWTMIREKGAWLGVGLGQYPSWSNLYGGQVVAHRLEEGPYYNELLIEHAHNEYLEWIAEGGVIALFFGLLMLLHITRYCRSGWPTLATLLVLAAFNSPFHSAPHAMAGLIIMGIAARGRQVYRFRFPELGIGPIRLLAAMLVVAVAATIVIPSYLVRQAEAQHLAGQDPLPYYERVEAWIWPHGEGAYSHGVALAERGALTEAIDRLEKAEGMVETGRRYNLLAELYQAVGEQEKAAEAYREYLRRWPWRQTGDDGRDPELTPPETDS